jgi:hypothetical protein
MDAVSGPAVSGFEVYPQSRTQRVQTEGIQTQWVQSLRVNQKSIGNLLSSMSIRSTPD